MKQTFFGTDGIRAKIGQSPITHGDMTNMGNAIAQWALERYCNNPHIIIGSDTRESCDLIKAALKTGLLLHNVTLYDASVIPTPAIAALMQQKKFDCGIMITASHNPYQDNGIKIIDSKHGKLTKDDENKITQLFFDVQTQQTNCGSFGSDIFFQEAQNDYVAFVTNHFEKKMLDGLKIVVDCAHGATSGVAKTIFDRLGATAIFINNKPNGKNINAHCGSLYPQGLQKAVLEHNAVAGFAFDGDGDRITAVNKNGKIKDGDDILALLLNNPTYEKQNKIVGTIITNQGFEQHLNNRGKKLIRTKVGDKFVATAMRKDNLLLGGEPSGHIVLGNYLHISDGIFAALKIIETMKITKNWDMETFKKYPQALINITVKEKKDLDAHPFTTIVAENKSRLKNGRIIVRYSGTQKLLRVMVEEESHDIANEVCAQLSNKLKIELCK